MPVRWLYQHRRCFHVIATFFITLWSKDLMDTDKGVDAFISGCHVAGPGGCHLWAPTEENIRQNMTRLFDEVRKRPVSVVNPPGPYDVIDIDALEAITFASLYQPYVAFHILAEAYAALAQGDGSIVMKMAGGIDLSTCPAELELGSFGEASAAILCNDGEEVPSDLASTLEYVEMMKELSPQWSPFWVNIRMSCMCVA